MFFSKSCNGVEYLVNSSCLIVHQSFPETFLKLSFKLMYDSGQVGFGGMVWGFGVGFFSFL